MEAEFNENLAKIFDEFKSDSNGPSKCIIAEKMFSYILKYPELLNGEAKLMLDVYDECLQFHEQIIDLLTNDLILPELGFKLSESIKQITAIIRERIATMAQKIRNENNPKVLEMMSNEETQINPGLDKDL